VVGTPADQTYSYSFDGNAQSLDHVLLSVEAAGLVAAFDHARVNADFPEIYRGDDTRVERTSDHDPAIAYFRFPRDTTPPVVTVPGNQQVAAQGPFGAVVTWTATATDDIDGAVAVTCTPGSGALFAFGATTVVCTASDAAGNVGSASFTVTVVEPTTAGWVVGATVQGQPPGGARAVFSAIRTSFGMSGASLVVLEQTAPWSLRLFVATRIEGVAFFDDPASTPGATPASGIDTVRVLGTGTLNGTAGHSFELVAADRGEPGRGRDEVTLTVRDAQGVVVLSSTGPIDRGNVDSLRVP
jgi:HYR domain